MREKYATSQIALHWLTLLLIAVAYTTIELRGLAARGTVTRSLMIMTHFSCGVSVWVLMLVRAALRHRHTSPDINPAPPRWQHMLAHLMHFLLYALFLALPTLGVASKYLNGRPWQVFGLSMPVSSTPNFDLADTLIGWHETLAPLGYWLIGLHAVAALLHHYILKDNTLIRMMPARKRNP
ncbi:Cytochrome b(561) [Pantoea sp. AS-PWVM4]|uniref:cytochrome b561 n=1 Tax=Pantoea sp. AS-PWVM4 TaxID=1332069 RepID=UPI0003AC6277|nr:cytochrome b561 [Pantoea sp. AS-PWVM4]ERK17546.1 Cytochrome b(561) [Pantoea sp. AS-PWVM4]